MKRTYLLIITMTLAFLASASWFLIFQSKKVILQSGVQSAAELTLVLKEFRSLYASEVVNRVGSDIDVTHDYINKDGAIPLPATFTMMLGKQIGNKGHGESVKLYSEYPFPWRKDSGVVDAFEKDAMSSLLQNPNTPYFRMELINDVETFRYATAEIMYPSCVNCHNTHPDSPKKDWQVGDVRGVLEVNFPISSLMEDANDHLNRYITLVLVSIGLVFLLGVWFFLKSRHEKIMLKALASEKTLELNRANLFNRSVVDNAVEGIITISTKGIIKDVNNSTILIFGYTPQELIGRNVNMLMPTPFHEQHDQYIKNFLETGEAKVIGIGREVQGRRKDGTTFPLYLAVSKVEVEGEIFFTGLVQDITERKNAEEKIYNMAHYDNLTQLANRTLFYELLNYAITFAERDKQNIALLFIDLDGFKTVNDSLGHNAGDQLLIQVAERLKRCARESDTVARLGGDEFAVALLDVKDGANVAVKAKQIIESIEMPYPDIGEMCKIGCSIGIALLPDDASDMDSLVKKADEAMYVVKKHGKNDYCFYRNMSTYSPQRVSNKSI